MGFFDWLFGRKNKAPQSSTPASSPAPEPAPESTTTAPARRVPLPVAPAQEDDNEVQDWAEATTFISRRLSPAAQREIKSLRTLLAKGVQHYNWTVENDRCEPCKNACRKFVSEGPYAVGAGLSGQAPVPGRESPSDDCQCTVAAADGA